jgi:hypothetical protein
VLGQRAGSGGVGAGRGDAEPGHGEDLPPADNLVDLEWEIPDDPEWARRVQDFQLLACTAPAQKR